MTPAQDPATGSGKTSGEAQSVEASVTMACGPERRRFGVFRAGVGHLIPGNGFTTLVSSFSLSRVAFGFLGSSPKRSTIRAGAS